MSDQRRPATFRLDDPAVAVSEVGHRVQAPVQIVPEAEPVDLPAIVERSGAAARTALGCDLLQHARRARLARRWSLGHAVDRRPVRTQRDAGLCRAWAGRALRTRLSHCCRPRDCRPRAPQSHRPVSPHAAEAVLATDNRTDAQGIVRDLLAFAQASPRLARPRATLAGHIDDIIDGADLIRLAERELMAPLDEDAKRLISSAAQRVSIVTAASPRAVVDILFVAATGLRLVRQLAVLYGGRPGALGTARLVRLSIAHLAVTGGMAATDSLIHRSSAMDLRRSSRPNSAKACSTA